MSVIAVMASQLLQSMSGSNAGHAPRIGGASFFADARKKKLTVAKGDCSENIRRIRVQNHRTSSTVCGPRENHGRLLDGSVSRRTCEMYRRKEMQPCRSMRNDDGSGAGMSSDHIAEQSDCGGETTSECLYIKRTVCDGETVEHSGSITIMGDVKHGGCVSAGGDVIVLGRLQGTVQAGRAGNHSAKVFTALQGSGAIKIGDEATLQLTGNGNCYPHVAELAPDGRILIRPPTEQANEGQDFHPEKRPSLTEPSHKTGLNVSSTERDTTQNERPAQVALFTGIYISVAGLVLFAFPKLFGILFDIQSVSLGWIQVGAVLAVVFGVYYIGTAVGDMRGIHGAQAFYYSTVVGRTFLFLSFTWLVVTGAVPFAVLLVGIVNLVGAGLMWKALSEKRK